MGAWGVHTGADPPAGGPARPQPAAGLVGVIDAAATTDFAACYRDHYPQGVRALRLSGAAPADAEEAAQEAFARALVHWWRVRRGANPVGYVYLSAFRELRRSGRRAARRRGGDDPGRRAADAQPDPAAGVDLEVALARMPLRRRQCAVLCVVLGFTPADAGRQLGIAAGTVRKHLDEARADLRQGWAEGG